ncbi:MAG: hypothetical protein QXF17_06090 [Ignisphaera sp.]
MTTPYVISVITSLCPNGYHITELAKTDSVAATTAIKIQELAYLYAKSHIPQAFIDFEKRNSTLLAYFEGRKPTVLDMETNPVILTVDPDDYLYLTLPYEFACTVLSSVYSMLKDILTKKIKKRLKEGPYDRDSDSETWYNGQRLLQQYGVALSVAVKRPEFNNAYTNYQSSTTTMPERMKLYIIHRCIFAYCWNDGSTTPHHDICSGSRWPTVLHLHKHRDAKRLCEDIMTYMMFVYR